MTLAAGSKLGRYEIRSKIGEGGMGEVYLAQDTKLDRRVALKILPADVAANQQRMGRFVQEAKAASALNHPNILTIYEIDETDSGDFIATEFIDGETLRERMRREPLKLSDVLEIAAQIASALSKRGRELDPLNLRSNATEGQALFFAGKYDESIVRLQKTVALEPNFWLPHFFLSRVYLEKKMYAEAIAEATIARERSGGNSEAIAHVVYALAKSGKQKEARNTLDELRKRAADRYVGPYAFALSYNGLGETDEAITWLVKGLEQRDIRMTLLTVDPKWNNLRSDPRFQDVLRRTGFTQ